MFNFNPRTREGCDGDSKEFEIEVRIFQSTHPRRVRPAMSWSLRRSDSNFNPRTREGCDQIIIPDLQVESISIHAPAKGATQLVHLHEVDLSISIHAPAKGATTIEVTVSLASRISIHAPAKGATAILFIPPLNKFISIHAPAKGATCFLLVNKFLVSYFNPRTREGCDWLPWLSRIPVVSISIHAPAKGATWQSSKIKR